MAAIKMVGDSVGRFTVAFAVSLLLLLLLLLATRRRNRNAGSSSSAAARRERERRAKESFRVRRSDLLRQAGKHEKKRRRRRRAAKDEEGSYERKGKRGSRENGDGHDAAALFRSLSSPWRSWWCGKVAVGVAATTTAAADLSPSEEGGGGDDEGDIDWSRVAFVGMDCEMVGGGPSGSESLLARCSVVALEDDCDCNCDGSSSKATTTKEGVRVLYDKYVRPTKRVVDYRTRWSGIKRDDLRGDGSLPVVPFDVCRREVADLFASVDGKDVVVVVGHALQNDFDALKLRHPISLIRDTATYRPFMRDGRRRMLQRKLSHLAADELGLSIQNSTSGHSSVEDAAAALRLYRSRRIEWEASLGHPLRSMGRCSVTSGGRCDRSQWKPLSLYLDGCNLPLALRRMDRSQASVTNSAVHDGIGLVPYCRLLSKTTSRGTSEVYAETDWIPTFRSALLPRAVPRFDRVVIMFDGAKFKSSRENKRPPKIEEVGGPRLIVEVSPETVSVDDVLVERCRAENKGSLDENVAGTLVSVEEVIGIFSNPSLAHGAETGNDELDACVVVRRRGGGSKTNRRLFDRLHLRRAEEGALCLTGLTNRLRKHSLHIARELQRARVHDIVEYTVCQRRFAQSVVVTNDVLLTDRLVACGTIVLSYRQLQQMF